MNDRARPDVDVIAELDRSRALLALPGVPPHVSRRLRALSERPARIAQSLREVHDTRRRRLAATRGAQRAGWSTSYAGDFGDIVLDIDPVDTQFRVSGHLFAEPGPDRSLIRAHHEGRLLAATGTDDLGQFDLGLFDRSPLQIVVRADHHEFEAVIDLHGTGEGST